MLGRLYLILAILLEVCGTTFLKLSDGLTKGLFVLVTMVFYIASIVGLGLALKKMDVSTAYAIWAGMGTALIAAIGFLYFHEPVSAVKVVSIGFIIAGVVGLNLTA